MAQSVGGELVMHITFYSGIDAESLRRNGNELRAHAQAGEPLGPVLGPYMRRMRNLNIERSVALDGIAEFYDGCVFAIMRQALHEATAGCPHGADASTDAALAWIDRAVAGLVAFERAVPMPKPAIDWPMPWQHGPTYALAA
jgi:hypothetical protein